jgi:hypothetical protein
MATNYNYFGGIVTDGLVLDLDAAKVASYPGTGTTWYDISGNNNNGTLTNGPTFSGIGKQASIVFDGVDDYVNLGVFQTLINNFTINLWCRITKTTAGNILGFYNINPPFNGWGLGFSQNPLDGGKLNFWDGTSWKNSNIDVTDSVLRNITVVINNTTLLSFYINGVFSTSIQGDTIPTFTGNKAIGARNDGLGAMGGSINTITIYNRALSADEVSQNFNALRGRYGI